MSDGKNTFAAIFSKECLALIENEELISSSIIKLKNFNATQANGKVLFMITEAEVLEKKAALHGNPVPLGNTSASGKANNTSTVKVESPPESKQAKPESESSTASITSTDHEMKDAVTSPTPKGPTSSQISSPPTVTKKTAAPIPQSSGGNPVIPIQGLNPYLSRWTIKAMVVTKQAIRTFTRKGGGGDSRVLSVTLRDDSCDIKVSFWNEAADRYEDTLIVGKCYTFSKGKTQMANRRFNDTKSEYELSFNGDCVVELCQDSEAPKITYDFCKIDRLDTMIGKVPIFFTFGVVFRIRSLLWSAVNDIRCVRRQWTLSAS